MAAWSLALNLHVSYRWVPSEFNVSDAPSRGVARVDSNFFSELCVHRAKQINIGSENEAITSIRSLPASGMEGASQCRAAVKSARIATSGETGASGGGSCPDENLCDRGCGFPSEGERVGCDGRG